MSKQCELCFCIRHTAAPPPPRRAKGESCGRSDELLTAFYPILRLIMRMGLTFPWIVAQPRKSSRSFTCNTPHHRPTHREIGTNTMLRWMLSFMGGVEINFILYSMLIMRAFPAFVQALQAPEKFKLFILLHPRTTSVILPAR